MTLAATHDPEHSLLHVHNPSLLSLHFIPPLFYLHSPTRTAASANA